MFTVISRHTVKLTLTSHRLQFWPEGMEREVCVLSLIITVFVDYQFVRVQRYRHFLMTLFFAVAAQQDIDRLAMQFLRCSVVYWERNYSD